MFYQILTIINKIVNIKTLDSSLVEELIIGIISVGEDPVDEGKVQVLLTNV